MSDGKRIGIYALPVLLTWLFGGEGALEFLFVGYGLGMIGLFVAVVAWNMFIADSQNNPRQKPHIVLLIVGIAWGGIALSGGMWNRPIYLKDVRWGQVAIALLFLAIWFWQVEKRKQP